MAYDGSIDLISGVRPKNGGGFPLVNAQDVYVNDDTRMSDVAEQFNGMQSALGFTGEASGYVERSLRPIKTVRKKMAHYDPNSTTRKWPDNIYLYGSSSFMACVFFDVVPGQTYYVTGASHSNSTEYPLCIMFNAEGIQVACAGTDQAAVYEDFQVNVPDSVTHMLVNKCISEQITPAVKERIPGTGVPIIDRFTSSMIEYDSRINDIEDTLDLSNSVQIGDSVVAEVVADGLWSISQDEPTYPSNPASTWLYAFFPVEPNSYYFVTCDSSGDPTNRPGGAFYDADDTVIDTFCNRSDYITMRDALITTPPGCVKILLNRAYTSYPLTCKKGYMASKDTGAVSVENSYNLNMADALLRLEKRNPVCFSPLDKGYVSFVWDDLWSDLDAVASLFETYNFPVCVSAIPDNIMRKCDGLSATRGNFTPGMNMIDVVNQIVSNGGEVLAHNTEVIGVESDRFDFDFMNRYYVRTKKDLTNLGYAVRGLIGSGGTAHDGSEVARQTKEQDLWMVGNYEYGTSGSLPQYYGLCQRTNINVPVSDTKAAILDAYTNHTWVKFMCHSYRYTGGGDAFVEADLIEVLDYCQSLGIPVVTYAYMFDHFATTELAEQIRILST